MNFYDMSGPEFLGWYAAFLLLSSLTAFVFKKCMLHVSSSDIKDGDIDQYDVAYLAGGAEQVFLSAVGTLGNLNYVRINSSDRTLELLAEDLEARKGLHQMEQSICEIVRWNRSSKMDDLFERFKPHVDKMRAKLAKLDLAPSEEREALSKLVATACYAAPLFIGIPRFVHGLQVGRPVTFLLIFLIISVVGAGCAFVSKSLRTSAGDDLLEKLRKENSPLEYNFRSHKDSMGRQDLALAYALFGGMMVISSLDPFMAARAAMVKPAVTGGGDGGCGSSCGGGCGGGCGG